MRRLHLPFLNLRQIFRAPAITPAAADILALLDASGGFKLGTATLADIMVAAPPAYIQFQDQKADGTAGDTFTIDAWTTGTLNTEVLDSGGHASVAANVVTLAAGTYEVEAEMALVGQNAGAGRLRLQNVTDATTAVGPGLTPSMGTVSTTVPTLSAFLRGRFTIASTKNFELQYFKEKVVTAVDDDRETAGVEVYADLVLRKVA